MGMQNKNVLVVGAGKSGIESCRFLLSHGAHVILYDGKTLDRLGVEVADLEKQGATLILGNQLPEHVTWDLVVTSPGVPPFIPVLSMSRAAGIEVIGEIELAYRFAKTPFLGVTGTNGKTTTTALLGHILQEAGMHILVGGNIGIPLAVAAADFFGDYIVAELSSFQLEGCSTFHPHVGVYLNLTPDHLDRHGSMENYAAAKARLFMNMEQNDFAVLSADDEPVRAIAKTCAAEALWFSLNEPRQDGMFFDGKSIHVMEKGVDQYSFPANRIYIKGRHNMQNAMAAALAAHAIGVSYAEIAAGLSAFPGVEHRLEYVCARNGVTYINDSKATNPASTYQALAAYEEPIILMLGGYDKHSDFSPLFAQIKKKVRQLVIYGESLPLIRQAAEKAGFTDYVTAENFRDAVTRASIAAQSGDVVLFSPACASWDEFKDFEQRGRLFKELVRG